MGLLGLKLFSRSVEGQDNGSIVSLSIFCPPSLPPTLPAFLTSDSVDLQELAANSDRLLSTLVSYLGNQPDENDEFVEEKHIIAYERLKEV